VNPGRVLVLVVAIVLLSIGSTTADISVGGPPAAPSGLVATAASNTQINLSWQDNATDETGFHILRKTGVAGQYSQIGAVGANVTTYQNTGVTANTAYFYQVRAFNASGNSACSNEAHAAIYALRIISPPTSLVATAVSNTRIDLRWTDNATDETGFNIERAPTSTGTWVLIKTVAANVVTYQNTGLAANTTYYYRVRAYKAGAGFSTYSNVANAKTYALAAPSGLLATAVSNTQINLSWTDNTTTESGFKIERKIGVSGTYGEIATVGPNTTTYQNTTGLTANTTYYYKVRAYKTAVGFSAYSNQVGATTYDMAAPSGLTATAVSDTQINLSWTDNSNETGFKIERKTLLGAYSEIGTAGMNATTYQDTGLGAGVYYYYRVRAYKMADVLRFSAYSTMASAITYAHPAPSNLVATAVSDTKINLSWTDNSTYETGFQIWRKIGSGGTYGQFGTVGANVTTYQDTGRTPATTYYYQVRAHSGGGDSAYSNEANAKTYALPAPSGLTATAVSSTQINLSWTDNSTNETGFVIQSKTGVAGIWIQIATLGANITTYQHTGRTPNTGYYYRVRAYITGVGNSNYSNTASALTPP